MGRGGAARARPGLFPLDTGWAEPGHGTCRGQQGHGMCWIPMSSARIRLQGLLDGGSRGRDAAASQKAVTTPVSSLRFSLPPSCSQQLPQALPKSLRHSWDGAGQPPLPALGFAPAPKIHPTGKHPKNSSPCPHHHTDTSGRSLPPKN